MTNAEKYEEIFGYEPDKGMCPARLCKDCPLSPDGRTTCPAGYPYSWWTSEYKGGENE